AFPEYTTLSLHAVLPILQFLPRGQHHNARARVDGYGAAPDRRQDAHLPRTDPYPGVQDGHALVDVVACSADGVAGPDRTVDGHRSEEHTSELQSRFDLVC